MTILAWSDSHFTETVGLEVTEIEADDVDGLLEAIRARQSRILGKRTPLKAPVQFEMEVVLNTIA